MRGGRGGSTSSSFRYQRAHSIADATTALSRAGASPMGGGTDLLVSLDEGFIAANLVVDLRRIPEGDAIESQADGSVRIGGSARIHDIAQHPLIGKPQSLASVRVQQHLDEPAALPPSVPPEWARSKG